MRKALVTVLALSMFCLSIPKANAVVGFLPWTRNSIAPAASVLAGALGGAALVRAYDAFTANDNNSGLFYGLGGVIALDESRQEIRFSPLSADEATKLSLTPAEFSAYNEELPLINLMVDEISRRAPRGEVSNDEAKRIYDEARTAVGLSDVASSSLQKVVAGAVK